tara:strand:+ start:3435 stop:4133 length:699 start_codon:yes stop_codon:yes gene_type:complete
MRYEHHNFSENFKAINKTKDMAITRELMLSEVAKVIEGRPALVRKALVNCGVKVSARAGKVELVSAVAYNLTSECVRIGIMKLVLSNQLPFIEGSEEISPMDTDASRDGFMNQVGGVPAPSAGAGAGVTGGQWLNGGVQVLSTIAGIWQGNKSYKEAGKQRAHELELAGMNRDLMLQQMELGANQTVLPPTQAGLGGSSKVVFILLGVGVLAVIGFAFYNSRKGSSSPAVQN